MGFSCEISVGELKHNDAKETFRQGPTYALKLRWRVREVSGFCSHTRHLQGVYLEVEMESQRVLRFSQPFSASTGRGPLVLHKSQTRVSTRRV